MPFGATLPSTERTTFSRRVARIDNQQVLEFLRLVDELKQVAALLVIEPARRRSSGKPNPKRPTPA